MTNMLLDNKKIGSVLGGDCSSFYRLTVIHTGVQKARGVQVDRTVDEKLVRAGVWMGYSGSGMCTECWGMQSLGTLGEQGKRFPASLTEISGGSGP